MRFGLCSSLVLLLVAGAVPLAAATPHLVKDIDPVPQAESSSPHDFVNALPGLAFFTQVTGASGQELWVTDGTTGGTFFLTSAVQLPGFGTWVASQKALYFVANDGIHGTELWRTDGTPGGTFLVTDLRPGPASSNVSELVEFNSKLFFQADDGRGPSLWASDGTPQGTRLVQNLAPQPALDLLPFFAVIGRTLVFTGPTSSNGPQLWRSDGTAKGTFSFTNFRAQPGSTLFFDFAVNKNRLVFVANTKGPGQQLWATDGSAKGTHPLTNFHPKKQQMFFNATFGSRLVFSADDGIHGLEYWMTDGTPRGTTLLKDLCAGPCSGSVGEAIQGGNLLYLVGTDGVHGQEPWVSNGTATGTRIIADLCLGSCDSKPFGIRPAGGFVYFVADDGKTGRQVWHSDGTAQGTFPLTAGSSPVTSDRNVKGLVLGSALVFAAGDAESGTELWRSDGTNQGTGLLVDLAPSDVGGSFPLDLTAIGDKVYFLAKSNGKPGPWVSDGSDAGTVAFPVPPQSQFPNSRVGFSGVPGSLFFVMVPFGESGLSLWHTDGPGSNPGRLSPEGVSVGTPTFVGNLAFFNGLDAEHGAELWVSDGTAAGTHLAADLQPSSVASVLGDFTAFQGHLYFTALINEITGGVRQLWRSDGTEAGTVLVSDVDATSLTVHDGRLWFFAQDGEGGSSLRSTDGTPAGLRIEPLLPGPGSVAGGPMFWEGSRLFFFGTATDLGRGLFVWDGAPGSLRLLGTLANEFFSPAAVGSRGALYFSARASGFQDSLWVSDGTEAGTRQILDTSGMPILDPQYFQVFAGSVYFTTHDYLYQTDGTAAGTLSLTKLSEPGAFLDTFHQLVVAGPRLFFRKWDRTTGAELWALEAN